MNWMDNNVLIWCMSVNYEFMVFRRTWLLRLGFNTVCFGYITVVIYPVRVWAKKPWKKANHLKKSIVGIPTTDSFRYSTVRYSTFIHSSVVDHLGHFFSVFGCALQSRLIGHLIISDDITTNRKVYSECASAYVLNKRLHLGLPLVSFFLLTLK